MSTVQQELSIYETNLPSWLKAHSGDFVVLQGSQVRHFEKTYEAALTWAYDQFGLDHFFVKQIDAEQSVAHFTRDYGLCRR